MAITYTYSRREARKLLERHGFRGTQLWVDHISPYRIAEYRQYRYVKAWPCRAMPPPVSRVGEPIWLASLRDRGTRMRVRAPSTRDSRLP